jgi:gliding motility-associated lipoprotein GldH
MKLSAIILIALCLFISCQEEIIYSETKSIDAVSWAYDDPISFKISDVDTSQINELQLILEHSKEYEFENIYLKVFTGFPDGNVKEERLSINLADKKGKWIGNCKGEICKLKVYLMEQFKFPMPGEYQFTFEQNSRTEKLDAIKSLELKLIHIKDNSKKGK